jgi:hypothetical protein
MGAQFKAIGQQTDNDRTTESQIQHCYNSPDLLTAVVEDMKYHLLCFSHAQRNIEKANIIKTKRSFLAVSVCSKINDTKLISVVL